MTKAEFPGSTGWRRPARQQEELPATPSTLFLDAITGALSAGFDEVSFTGFGKFHVAERGPRQGVNPRTGRRILFWRQSASLLRRLGLEVQGQGRLKAGNFRRVPAIWFRAPDLEREPVVTLTQFADRLAALNC
ncbi:MAG: HU family DNA-binding protein [Solirubrobacterales bacterium]